MGQNVYEPNRAVSITISYEIIKKAKFQKKPQISGLSLPSPESESKIVNFLPQMPRIVVDPDHPSMSRAKDREP
jgi:hypothetical protein